MAALDGLGLQFTESMAGYLGLEGAEVRFDVQIHIADLARFIRVADHVAELTGAVSIPVLGGTFPIRDGRFNLFTVDPHTGVRKMTYSFHFTAGDGQTYFLYGHKDVYDDPGKLDVFEDMTRLFTKVYCGQDDSAPVYAAGELCFKLRDLPALVASMKVLGATSLRQRVAAYMAFTSFAYGSLRDEYLKDLRLLYDTRYENLALAGDLVRSDSAKAPFFLASGVHDRGFPWGDNELFWDVLLVIGEGEGGYRRYAITDRVLEGLEFDIAGGLYCYRGPLFALADGCATSFSEMRRGEPSLVQCQAEIEIEFETRAFETVPFPFPLAGKLVRRLSSAMARALRENLPGENPLGIHITPHTVTVRSARVRLHSPSGQVEEWTTSRTEVFGEAERGQFRNLKEPTLLYNYLCALDPEGKTARVEILTRTLRDEREYWAKDRLDAFLGTVVSRMSSAEMLIERDRLSVKPLPPAGRVSERAVPLRKIGEPLVEVNNDHFPTAVFQRRIVQVEDASGRQCLALEEDMRIVRLEAIGCDREVTVASIRDPDKSAALDRVLEETGFDALVEAKLAASGKARPVFSIAIKPNFMFAYDRRDQSTYTDPELVAQLVRRLRARGFQTTQVVEAQSTYGEFFDRRSVREVAEYLGYDGSAGYEVIDMTEDALEPRQMGPHLGVHPVSKAWRDADFRISFAKNKTHAYAFYSLTLKNIYGALPLANKFKEYHCQRGIYHPAIEYLQAFPVDYGLVDAVLSADGPFGVFADPAPNPTQTVIGGADLVAVDWVAATKMGIDPMISQYMRLAVEAFGKPRIRLVGDASVYWPWLNVPVALTLFSRHGMDADYHFGNLLYSAASQMDESHFHHKSNAWYIRLLRWLTVPLRRTFFLRTGENPSLANRLVSWLLYRMGY
jgi:uncharacterized protein (DUF362 family)